jgi:hypothetical protein
MLFSSQTLVCKFKYYGTWGFFCSNIKAGLPVQYCSGANLRNSDTGNPPNCKGGIHQFNCAVNSSVGSQPPYEIHLPINMVLSVIFPGPLQYLHFLVSTVMIIYYRHHINIVFSTIDLILLDVCPM